MWPWDHLAVGYVAVSLWRRWRSQRPPGDGEALAVLAGTQLPDLVDKPLGWGTALLPSGHSLAHSLFVAVPTALVAYLVGRRLGRSDAGAAFALAYLSHLPGDVLYPAALGRGPNVAVVLWPVADVPASRPDALAGHVLDLILAFAAFLGTPRGAVFLALEVTLLSVAAALWSLDGWPGPGAFRRTPDRDLGDLTE